MAREKAREAVESVHTARDMRVITWNEIRNESRGGKFLDGELDMKSPGEDGLVNTDDDDGIEEQLTPGLDNVLGTDDDVHAPLKDYKREIQITDLPHPDGGTYDDLRQVRVIIRYKVGGTWRSLHAVDLHLLILMMTAHHVHRRPATDQSGFSLVELLITTGIMSLILGISMSAMNQAMRANEMATMLTSMNAQLRTGMDLIVRDLLQTGQDLPVGRVISVPSGAGSGTMKLPGPPGTSFNVPAGTTQLSAVIPGPGLGHTVNGRATDIITFLAADSSFSNVDLDNISDTTMQVKLPCVLPAVCNGINIVDGGADDLVEGQLIMLTKGSMSTLVQITGLAGQTATFANGDSLGFNRSAAVAGSLRALNLSAPSLATSPAAARDQTQASRIRMISYYIDATANPARPALVRRMNNGHPTDVQQHSRHGRRVRRREPGHYLRHRQRLHQPGARADDRDRLDRRRIVLRRTRARRTRFGRSM